MDLFFHQDWSRMSLEDCNVAMRSLRAFPKNNEEVFQSYHSAYDPDRHNFLPSGTVGIPPVNSGYLALAYRYVREHGYEAPNAHFWSIIGDSEFREGSLSEAIPDFAEREIGDVTWILDYNRQSLDGHRIFNNRLTGGTDANRIKGMMEANGWEVLEARHGRKRLEAFKRPGGEEFKDWFENKLSDYELQTLLNVKDTKALKGFLLDHHGRDLKQLDVFLKSFAENEIRELLLDFGGHDIEALIDIFEKSKVDARRPTFVIAHTIKGWGLDMAATAGNHSALPEPEEMDRLRKATGLAQGADFARFENSSVEGKFLAARSEKLFTEMQAQHRLKGKNDSHFMQLANQYGEIPETLDINFKMASFPHTQWMLGQLTSKLTRIANTPVEGDETKKQKALTDFEKRWKLPAELMVSMAPDVGTSTNLNPSMDGKIFGPEFTEDFETELNVKDKNSPDLVPHENQLERFLRFEIAEANVTSCVGSFGKLREILGIPVLPLMTVYDFFIKRAHDQLFYDLYWKSSFILVGTPSGVTLSPEGAQHGWKSDYQIPNQITWEPLYVQELDWIFADAVKRHLLGTNEGRTGVIIRGVTRGIDQKDMLNYLRKQKKFKSAVDSDLHPAGMPVNDAIDEATVDAIPDGEIMAQVREDVLAGGYYLINYQGYANYVPGDNVVNIFAMGSPATEAIKASQKLLELGIYANVIVVTGSDLLLGNLGHENNYAHLRETLAIDASLFVTGNNSGDELVTIAGRRVPIVSVHDGEPGLLDNIGSIVGVRQESLAVRKHSKCGRPSDVYRYHHIDCDAIVEACGKVLSETAMEDVQVSSEAMARITEKKEGYRDWRELWHRSSH